MKKQKAQTLHLNLIKKWFNMIKEDIKPEEYRDITPYWVRRLFNWREYLNVAGLTDKELVNFFVESLKVSDSLLRYLKPFDTITFSNGMRPPVPRYIKDFISLELRGGKQEWGATEGKRYFVFNLGETIN